jgi:hypothetical protein
VAAALPILHLLMFAQAVLGVRVVIVVQFLVKLLVVIHLLSLCCQSQRERLTQ